MTRRQRGARRGPERASGSPEPAFGPARGSGPEPGRSLREQIEGASPAARALLPVRFFFGLTFVYAGLDKILDPAFLSSGAPTSIAAQLAAFARTSPLAFLIKPVEPLAVPVGIVIALAEVAIGLGALSGLAYRLAAVGGAGLSLLFFLTASWSTRPYYFGADLPYAFGWLALAIAGSEGLLVPGLVARLGTAAQSSVAWASARSRGPGPSAGIRPPWPPEAAPSPGRRLLVQAGVLAAASVVVTGVAVPLRILRRDDAGAGADAGGDAGGLAAASGAVSAAAASPDRSSAATTTPVPGGPTSAPHASPTGTFTPSGLTVATTAMVDQRGALRIRVPISAPSPLPAGDPAMIVKLTSGGYACFDAVCTHEGCRVGWDAQDGVMLCPCHGAAFDPNDHAAVLQGPTNQPLLELPITIDPSTGAITLKA